MSIFKCNFKFINDLSLLILLIITLLLTAQSHAERHTKPKIQQGVNFEHGKHNKNDISQYLISEKLDGMRGFWTGQRLISRQGNVINTPKWFTQGWPKTKMDGELWSGRSTFQSLMSCVKRRSNTQNKHKNCWKKIKFMIFDLPDNLNQFALRVKEMNRVVSIANSPYLAVIQQEVLKNTIALQKKLNDIIQKHGEGLMLHLANAHYQVGRNTSLLKLKHIDDAEAVVIGYTIGKGKYAGMLGALKVKTTDGIIFKIGSGFSDLQRKNPPPIGSIVTYRYNGLTKAKVPRFARFWRIKSVD